MMKLLCIYSSLTFLFSNPLHAQAPTIEWSKCYGGVNGDVGYSIDENADGSFILAGTSSSDDDDVTKNHDGWEYWIVKIDATGEILWEETLGGAKDDSAYSIRKTTDGGFIACGKSNSQDGNVTGNHSGSNDYWVVKFNDAGDIVWQKSLGGSGSEYAYSIQQTSDGGFIVAGSSTSNDGDVSGNHGNSDYWIVKLDAFGNIIWEKSFGGSMNEVAHSVIQTFDGGFIVAGSADSHDGDVSVNKGYTDYWIVKLDGMGNLNWQKSLGGNYTDEAFSIEQTWDTGFIVAGYSNSIDGDVTGNHGVYDYWIVKLEVSGNIEWEKCFGGNQNDMAESIEQTSDGGYIVGGSTLSHDGDVSGHHGGNDYWAVKLNSSGSLLWQRAMGGNNLDVCHTVHQSLDGGFLFFGETSSSDGNVIGHHSGHDYWLVKLFADQTGIHSPSPYTLSLNPNPVQNLLTISIGITANDLTIHVYDLQGREMNLAISNLPVTTSKSVQLNTENLLSGFYTVQIINHKTGQSEVGKFVKGE